MRPVAPGFEEEAAAQVFLQQRPQVRVKGKRGDLFADGLRHLGARVAHHPLRQHGMGIQVVVNASVAPVLEQGDVVGGKGVHVAKADEELLDLASAAKDRPLVPDVLSLAQGDSTDVS